MLAYNVQPLAHENLTGIGYYAANTLGRLLKEDKECELHVFDFMGRNDAGSKVAKNLGEAFDPSALHIVKNMPLGAYIRAGNAGKMYSYEALTHSKADMTVFFNYLVPAGLKGKSVITIYDMVSMRYPETMDDRNRRLLQRHLKPSAEKAAAVVTISEFSKKEIKELLNVPEERIFVAPCGTDTTFYCPFPDEQAELAARQEIKKQFDIDRYILYVGTLEPRKNIKTLVAAFEETAKEDEDIKLVLAGGVGWHSEETLAAIEGSPVRDRIVRTGYVSNEMKRDLYRCAKVFVFPSMYEGFGMPVTEAMACGTPCIISDTSSLPEVAGGIADIVGVYDIHALSEAMLGAIGREITDEFRKSAVANAARYTWEEAARAYRQALSFVTNADMI